MPKKTERQEYYIKGKDVIVDPTAPIVSDEFVDTTREEGNYQGATLQVQSETHLEDDLGTGKPYILRSYEFRTNPQLLRDVQDHKTAFPTDQELFNNHAKGIAGMLWSDGMTPETGLDPVITFSRDRSKYMIMVWAKPQLGQVLTHETKTLSEIAHGSIQNTDSVQRGVPVPSTKKKKTGRAA